jgi:hypothetical protein
MADRYLLESGSPDGYQLEDGSGVLILEGAGGAAAPAYFRSLLGVGFSILMAAVTALMQHLAKVGQ